MFKLHHLTNLKLDLKSRIVASKDWIMFTVAMWRIAHDG